MNLVFLIVALVAFALSPAIQENYYDIEANIGPPPCCDSAEQDNWLQAANELLDLWRSESDCCGPENVDCDPQPPDWEPAPYTGDEPDCLR